MTYPTSHKTVFVLDHGYPFGQSCKQSVEFDIFVKTRQPGIIPLAPVAKSMWTCSVEAAIEYCRIVWDLFPAGKLIRFVISDTGAQFLNSWAQNEQNLNLLMNRLAVIGPPQENLRAKDTNIVHGLSAAVEALCQCSEIQHEKRTSLTENAGKVLNRGCVVVITNLKSDAHARNLEECFLNAVIQHNKVAASSDNLIQIHSCELVLVHTHPVTEESLITQIKRREISPVVSSEIHAVKSGRHVAAKLGYLVLHHYALASTTVTGIPMKEEQNASSSANYDVEILHGANAHIELQKTGFLSSEGVRVTMVKEGQSYETMTLKWCTPRSNAVELHFCTGAFRVTPVDVNSRPSSCLTNFLLSGRAVMLEMPRKSGSKVLSHMLASHGGELFIHTLGTARSTLEDPPSISEGCGGRVTDYRINDFGEFMKENRLLPLRGPITENPVPPIEKAKINLERITQYYPIIIGQTTIFNMASLTPLINLIMKEVLTPEEVLEGKSVIYQLIGMESKGTPLPTPCGSRGKGPRREEQYRMMWGELETFIRIHCTTVEHRQILDCVLECRKPGGSADEPTNLTMKDKIKVEDDHLVKKEFPNRYDGEKSESKEDLRLPPPIKKLHTIMDEGGKGHSSSSRAGPRSVLSIWTERINHEHSKYHKDFVGRINGNNKPAVLYASLMAEAAEGQN